jgi:hypothetical protein
MKKSCMILVLLSLFGLSNVFSQIPGYVPTNGLVAWYPFNGNANDESGIGNNGTVNGATLTADRFGNASKAYSFNGANNNYIEIPNNVSLNSLSGTWSIWLKISTTTTNDVGIISRGTPPNSYIDINQGGGTNFIAGEIAWQGTNNVNLMTTQSIADNTWHLIVLTYDGSISTNNCSIYIDGDIVTTGTYNKSVFSIGGNVIRIGRSLDTYWKSFSGLADDIAIYNRVLTSDEISTLYESCILTINSQPYNSTVKTGNSAQFIISTTGNNVTYQWQTDLGTGYQNISNAGQFSGATTVNLTVSNTTLTNNNQVFRCIVTDGNCKDTSDVATLKVGPNSIENVQSEKRFTIYPNPTNGVLNIISKGNLINKEYTITNQFGQTVLKGLIKGENTKVNIESLSNGVYYINITGFPRQALKVLKN